MAIREATSAHRGEAAPVAVPASLERRLPITSADRSSGGGNFTRRSSRSRATGDAKGACRDRLTGQQCGVLRARTGDGWRLRQPEPGNPAFRLFWGFSNRSIGSVSYLAWGSAESTLLADVCRGTLRCLGRRVDDFLRSTTATDKERRAAAIATVTRYRAWDARDRHRGHYTGQEPGGVVSLFRHLIRRDQTQPCRF
jgi:hypothetical protein